MSGGPELQMEVRGGRSSERRSGGLGRPPGGPRAREARGDGRPGGPEVQKPRRPRRLGDLGISETR